METLDKNKFTKLLIAISEIYGKEMSPPGIEIYYQVLKNYSYDEIQNSLYLVVKTNKYNVMPKPAEIIENIEGSIDERALWAWQQLLDAIRQKGYYASVEFEDKTIHAVVLAMGGWMRLCDLEISETPFVMKEFIAKYKLFLGRKIDSQRLIGFYEMDNTQKGFPKYIPPTIFIDSDFKKDDIKQLENKKDT